MVDMGAINIALVPSLGTASVATLGYAGWLKFRRRVPVAPRELLLQFSLSFVATLFVGHGILQSKRRSREAFDRMMRMTEGTTHVHFTGSGSTKIPVEEYDAATGVNAEEETRKILELADKP
jgi:hypothetical protein